MGRSAVLDELRLVVHEFVAQRVSPQPLCARKSFAGFAVNFSHRPPLSLLFTALRVLGFARIGSDPEEVS